MKVKASSLVSQPVGTSTAVQGIGSGSASKCVGKGVARQDIVERVHMMALFAARQRTADEYDRLAGQCNFRRAGTINTPAGISILEYERI